MEGMRDLEIRYSSINHGISSQYAEEGDRVKVYVTGKALDGRMFWQRRTTWFTVGAGEMPRGLEEGILRVSLGQRAKLFCSPAYAAHPGGDPSVPVGVPAVFEVQLKEIVSWTTVGEEVWRMKLNGACTCVSTLIKCPGASSLAALFPDGGPPSPPPPARLPTTVAAALAAAPLPVPAGVGLQQHPAA